MLRIAVTRVTQASEAKRQMMKASFSTVSRQLHHSSRHGSVLRLCIFVSLDCLFLLDAVVERLYPRHGDGSFSSCHHQRRARVEDC